MEKKIRFGHKWLSLIWETKRKNTRESHNEARKHVVEYVANKGRGLAVLKGKEFTCVYQWMSKKGFRNLDLTGIQSVQNHVENEANLLLPNRFSSPFLLDVLSSSSSMERRDDSQSKKPLILQKQILRN